MIEVFLVSSTRPDWETLFKVMSQGLSRNIGSGCDARRIPCNSLKAYLMCLGEMSNAGCDPIRFAREAGVALRQVSVCFAIATTTDTLYEIGIGGSLHILETDHNRPYTLALVSGNLEEWRNTILNGSGVGASYGLRNFCNKIVTEFDKMDLGIIFDNYARRTQKDQTFALVVK